MSRVQRKRRKKTLIIVIEIICLLAAGFYVYYIAEKKAEEREKALAEEQKKQEQLAKEKAEKEKEEKEKEKELDRWYLMLVNNDHAIPDDYEVNTADTEDGYRVDERIKDNLEKMLSDCREAGYSPQIISAFRSHETQQALYDSTANKADTAVPGHSEHECGLAVDIIDSASAGWGDPLIAKQEEMPAQKWLMEHCQDYGFILRYPKDKEDITEIIYEPWHYRYVGEEHAKEIMKSGVCLEEYIESLTKQN